MTDEIGLKFSPKLFTPLFSKIHNCTTRWLINYGGAGSSKSYSQGQNELIKSLQKKEKILVLRKVGSTLKDSVIPLFIEEYFEKYPILKNYYTYHKSDRNLTNIINGSKILFRGFDNPEKIKSIQGISRVWCEEASEFTEEDINQLNIRMRGIENIQFSLTFNPISEDHWLKKRFFDLEQENCTVFHTTYHDNNKIDNEFKKQIEAYKKIDYNFYKVYALGEWGSIVRGNEFYDFNPQLNIEDCKYDPEKALHITLDFNVIPYMTLCVWQVHIEGRKHVLRQIKEYCLPSPLNKTLAIARKFAKDFAHHNSTTYVYGDPSGKSRDTRTVQGTNDFTIFNGELKPFRPKDRVLRKAPSIAARGNFISSLMRGEIEDRSIFIDPKCKETIRDYEQLKEDAEGKKYKQKVKDPKLNISYEKYGHTSDANDYFICKILEEEYKTFIGKRRRLLG